MMMVSLFSLLVMMMKVLQKLLEFHCRRAGLWGLLLVAGGPSLMRLDALLPLPRTHPQSQEQKNPEYPMDKSYPMYPPS